MNWDEALAPADAVALVAVLAEHFKVRAPRIKFTGCQRRRGMYLAAHKTIRVAPGTSPAIVAHEFAHYLDHIDNGRVWSRMANDKEWHSQGFYYKLRKITLALGPGYPWSCEYRQIARWAARDESLVKK